MKMTVEEQTTKLKMGSSLIPTGEMRSEETGTGRSLGERVGVGVFCVRWQVMNCHLGEIFSCWQTPELMRRS